MYKKILLYFSIFSVSCQKLPLPPSLSFYPVSYESVIQIDGWSCGYNMLFNAANIEKRFGINQPNAKLQNFLSICKPYVQSCGLRPSGYSTNDMLEALAKKLKLCPFYYMHILKDQVYFNQQFSYQYSPNASYYEKEKAKQKGMEKATRDKILELKKYILSNRGKNTIIHFGCGIMAENEPHVILISLVIDNLGKKRLYINDNLNAAIHESSQAKKHLSFLIKSFL